MSSGSALDRALDLDLPRLEPCRSAPTLFALDGDGRIVRASLHFVRLIGRRTNELVGSSFADLLAPLDRADFQEHLFDLRAGAEGREWETTLLAHDGGRPRVRVELLGGTEPFSGLLVLLTGDDLAASNLRGREVLDAFPGMIFMSDAMGKPLYSNAALRSRFGRPLISGIGGVSLIHHEDRSALYAAWQEALVVRTAFACELRMASSGEPYRWFRQQTHPHHDDGGQVLYWISNLTDIEEERAAEAALTEARRFIARFGEATPDIMFLFDLATGGTLYCSEASSHVLGYSPTEMRAMGSALLPTIVHEEDWPMIAAELARGIENPATIHEGATTEYRAVRKDGEVVWLSTRSLVFERDEDGRPKTMLGVSQDVTLRRLAEIEREDHTRILENALSGVSVLDRDGRYVFANTEYAVLMGRAVGELVGEEWSLGLHADDAPRLRAEYERMAATARGEARRIKSECRGVCPDGTLVHQHVVLVPKYSGDRFVGHYRFVRDVTERVRFQHQLESQLAHISSMSAELEHRSDELERANAILSRQAASDGLTGLANHRAFQETMAALNEARRPHALLLFDVDRFKLYNDEFGHPAGDVVLCEFARLLSETTTGDDLAARYGGEEFAMILPDVDLEAAEARAGEILRRLGEIAWPHREITASVGGAVWTPGRSRAELIEAADRALYVSKRNGRNRVTTAA